MKRIAHLLSLSALLLASACANAASVTTAETVMRLTLQTRGNLETTNTNVRYYVVLNTATLADTLSLTPSAADLASVEASASTGQLPPNGGSPAGPRVYGPWLQDKPRNGWDLPFYLSGPNATTSTDPRRTISYAGTVPLLPVTWTDYFELTSEYGPLQVLHSQHPNPVSNPSLILQNVNTLQQGQDWFVQGNSLILLIRLSTLVNGRAYQPAPGSTAQSPLIVQANFVTSNTQGQIIDQWNVSGDIPGVTLHTYLNAQDQSQKGLPPLFPQNNPSGVSADSMTLTSYNSEIRQ